MARFVPKVDWRCHVCGNTYVIRTELKPGRGIVSDPTACPFCTAPVRSVPPIQVGEAKDLLLTHYGMEFYRKRFGSAEDYLFVSCRYEEDADTYLSLIASMDFDVWEKSMSSARRGDKPTSEEREILKLIPKMRDDARTGRLMTEMRRVAEAVKEKVRAERKHYLSIFEQRRKAT